MSPGSHKNYYFLRLGADLLLIVVSFTLAAFFAKKHFGILPSFFFFEWQEWMLLITLVFAWLVSARLTGLYFELHFRVFQHEILAFLKMVLVQALTAVFFLFFWKTLVLSRFFIAVYIVFIFCTIGGSKIVLRFYLGYLREQGRNLRFILIVGAGEIGRRFAGLIESIENLGYRFVGFIDDSDHGQALENKFFPIRDLEKILSEKPVDEVVIATPDLRNRDIMQILSVCEKYPVSLRMIPDVFDFLGSRFQISNFGPFPLISIRAIPLDEWYRRVLKRFFDIVFSIFMFVFLFSWLWPVIAIIIKSTTRGPVFFKQERWGVKNRPILCYKFRTMISSSKDIDENGSYKQATRDDSRITSIGRFLRRTNIDELPQFINVLKGEMSIVGPRPHPTPLNLESMDKVHNYLVRHMIKPGITGWAQVNGYRGETRKTELMKKRVEHDIWYIENWSFLLDMRIIWLTLKNMILGDRNAF